ncbi:MAG: PQQ-binding-like beta-propeller repeat protein [Acidimicrobiaceae bacterium]|nr:PQQ-binding-like beta-propeller repeat protein [Acidimicrobiaceae bacterium]
MPPFEGWVDPETSGQPWGDTVEGLLTFRGNPTRTYYGKGPVPRVPEMAWHFPRGDPMCSLSSIGGELREWCGTGWTGQPAVFERDGRTWVVVGAFSGSVHFLDADTGERLLPDFPTGDIIKGSVTIDPDGYPLVYVGSRDNRFRVVAFDAGTPRELWSLGAYDLGPIMWNDDWDSSGMVIDDHLFIGGENSRFHIVKLNRGYGADGLVTADPQVVFHAPGWDDELLAAVDRELSIENSVAVSGDTVYFANSGGLVQGWDISGLRDDPAAVPERVFRFWTGDDTDASLVIDAEGMIYVGVEYQRGTDRSHEVGQIIKLDPSRPDDPLIWSVHVRGALNASGVWATPGLHRDLLIVPTHTGHVYGVDTATGEVRWTKKLPGPTWPSPAIVDDVWIQGDCGGKLYAFDVSDTTVEPPQLWNIELGACIESTPAVWDGLIVVGTKGGYIHAIR